MSRKAAYRKRKRERERSMKQSDGDKWKSAGNSAVTSSGTQTIESVKKPFSASSPDSLKQLESMAQRGEIPAWISEGSREERERIYEAIDRLYPAPPGELNNYEVIQVDRRHIEVRFRHDMMTAESPGQLNLTRPDMSESARSGMIKQAIYLQRDAAELALVSRKGGFPSYEMANRYGRRVLSDAEKAQADREIESYIQSVLKSPMSKGGRELNAINWRKVSGGWERALEKFR